MRHRVPLTVDRDAFIYTEYVICFKIDQRIFDILGFKCLQRERDPLLYWLEWWTLPKRPGFNPSVPNVYSSLRFFKVKPQLHSIFFVIKMIFILLSIKMILEKKFFGGILAFYEYNGTQFTCDNNSLFLVDADELCNIHCNKHCCLDKHY